MRVRVLPPRPILDEIMKTCLKCKLSKDENDFYMKDGKRTHSYCKKCVNEQTIERQRALKLLAIEYKGGVCHDCGESYHPAVYDFHHLNPSEKDFSIGRRKSLKFSQELKDELDKCVLLCSNCHRVRHAKY